jgi:type IV pilus assembly protein PilB
MAVARKDVGDLLVDTQVITPAQLAQARETQKTSPGDIGQIIVDLGFGSAAQVMQARATLLKMRFIDLNNTKIQPEVVNIPGLESVVRRHKVMPFAKMNNMVFVAVSDTQNVLAMDDLRSVIRGMQIQPVLALPEAIDDAIGRTFKGGNGTAIANQGDSIGSGLAGIKDALDTYKATEVSDGDEDPDTLAQVAEQAPIIRVANTVIQQAIRVGASDIHIEPDRRHLRIRYRVDGVLHEEMTIPKYIQAPLISRFKIMADMNIAERRVPQDGRIPVRLDNKDYDLRVSCLPTIYGEKIVCRILDKSSVLIGLSKLGFSNESLARMEELIIQPNGMILMTGPTGSGKTTTLYSILHKINSVEKNICTVEDPVEYQLSGIAQVHVNVKAGLTFASSLRSFLRQDPDIIMVGEMRDLETAEIAIESSLTGHLVLSTIHTNDAPSAVIRLVDMGIEPYLISATIIGILAQRLARKVCQNCKEEYEVPASELRVLGYDDPGGDGKVTLWRGRGCDICRHTGLKGRLGIYELLTTNEEICELISRRAPLGDLRAAARANGMKTLREDGLEKVLAGVTTIDEVRRVVFTAGT